MRKIFNIMLAFMLLCSSAFAGTKISELTELTAGAGDDFFAIVDDTDTTTKKITRDSLFGGELIVDDTNSVIKTGDYSLEASGTGNTSRSTGNLLTDDCEALTGWTESSSGAYSSVDQVTFETRETILWSVSQTTGGAFFARARKDFGSFSGTQYITFRMYHADLGTIGAGDSFIIQLSNGTNRALLKIGSDDIEVFDGSSYTSTGTVAIQDDWYEFHIHINWTAFTLSLYQNLEGISTSTTIIEDTTFGGTETDPSGTIEIIQSGQSLGIGQTGTYVDTVLFGDTLESAGNTTITNTIASLTDNVEQSFLTGSDVDGNIFAQGKIYGQDDLRIGQDASIGNKLFVEGDTISHADGDVTMINSSDSYQVSKATANVYEVQTANRLTANTGKAEMVMIGDSIAYGYNTTITIEDYIETGLYNTCTNKGVNGNEIADVLARITTDMTDLDPRFGIILVGTNDVDFGTTLNNFLSDYEDVLDAMVADDIIPVVCSIPPRDEFNSTESQLRDSFNEGLYDLVKTYENIYWVDLQYYLGQFRTGGDAGNLWDYINTYGAVDNVHLTNAGNEATAKGIIEAINEVYIKAPLNLGDKVKISGRLGIGTGSPNEALHVAGSIEIEDNSNNCKLIVDTDGTCDTGTSIGTDTSIALCLSCS